MLEINNATKALIKEPLLGGLWGDLSNAGPAVAKPRNTLLIRAASEERTSDFPHFSIIQKGLICQHPRWLSLAIQARSGGRAK